MDFNIVVLTSILKVLHFLWNHGIYPTKSLVSFFSAIDMLLVIVSVITL